MISEQIRQAIKASGQTQTQIADGAGVTQRAVSDFLRGKGVNSAFIDATAEYLGLRLKVPIRLRGEQDA